MSEGKRKKRLKDYDVGGVLGEGAFGAVVLATDKETGKQYAIKMLDKKHILKQNKTKYVKTERDILAKCKHPGIIKLMSTFQDSDNLYYVLELANNGELLSQIRKLGTLSMECVKFYAAELMVVVEYLHRDGIVHRDLKPENILLDENMHLKLTDFGTAKIIGTDRRARSDSFVGTAEYISPELLQEKVASRESDLWAVGCIIYQMFAGRPAFRGATEFLTFKKVTEGNISFPENFPVVAKDLIQKILVQDPAQRYSIEQIKNSPFFDGIDWANLYNTKPPPFKTYEKKLIFPEDILKEEEERRKRIHAELVKTWGPFLLAGETIIKTGYIYKRRKLSIKKRMMILTSSPRLIYINVKTMKQMGEIPLSTDLSVEIKNDIRFVINVPGRSYILEDIERESTSIDWKDQIYSQLKKGGAAK